MDKKKGKNPYSPLFNIGPCDRQNSKEFSGERRGEGKGFAEPSSGIMGRGLKSTRHSIHKLNIVTTTKLHPLQGRGDTRGFQFNISDSSNIQ